MPAFNPALARWFRTHHGVVSRAQLFELGLSAVTIRALVASGELVVVHEGVYRHAAFPETMLSRCAAICAADDRLVISCGGAAEIWGFRKCSNIGLHATTTASSVPIGDGTPLHRCPIMPPEHMHTRADGIRVTSPVRTAFDVSKHVSAMSLESIIEQGLERPQFDVASLYAVGRMLCARGRDGSATFASVLTSRPAWRRPVGSHPELVLLKELARHGVVLETQVVLALPDQTIHPDLGDPTCGFYIEIDDHEWHGGRLASTYDHRRDRQVRLVGGRVERVSTDEIKAMKPKLIVDLVAAYHQHRSLSLRSG